MNEKVIKIEYHSDEIERLKYIRDRYIWSGINPTREVYSRQCSWVEFENGDMWRIASASDSNRGIRSHYAWIDSRASEEFVRCVIMRTLCCPSSPRRPLFLSPHRDGRSRHPARRSDTVLRL